MEKGTQGSVLDPAAAEFRPSPAGRFSVIARPQFHCPTPPFPSQSATQSDQVSYPATWAAATRAVVLCAVPRHVVEAEVRASMEAFGGVQAVDMAALSSEGVVTVHFYDQRSAQAVVAAAAAAATAGCGLVYLLPGATAAGNWGTVWGWLGNGRCFSTAGLAGWAQFAAAVIDEPNQGSVLVLNLDPAVSFPELAQIFGAFGAVKEVKAAPSNHHHKVVEFYDKRDAARALAELNGKLINGRRLVLRFASHSRCSYCSWCSVSICSKKNDSSHCKFSLPPRLVPKTSRFMPSAEATAPNSFLSSSPLAHKSEFGGKPMVRNTSSSSSMSNEDKRNSARRSSDCGKKDRPSKHQQRRINGAGGRNSWKNQHPKREGISRFLFKENESEESISSSSSSSCWDSRTTVMIRNIPNKYSQKLLLNMLDNHCIQCNEQIKEDKKDDNEPYSAYDFVYLPIDFNNKCNVGYGFVNMTSPEAAFRLYKAFHEQPWEVFNSRKICQITYARLQGLEELMERFRNSNFSCRDDEYMPVLFSPPRDGEQLTDPVSVAGSSREAPKASAPPLLATRCLLAVEEASRCNEDGAVG